MLSFKTKTTYFLDPGIPLRGLYPIDMHTVLIIIVLFNNLKGLKTIYKNVNQ